MKNIENDLINGSVIKKLVVFSIPLFIANLLQSFYGIIDMVIVGRFVGEAGIAAISNASMISFIINSICIGITTGGTVLTAQYKGAGDRNGQKETIGTLFTSFVIAALIITVLSLMLYRSIFNMMKIPAEAMDYACDYMQIICIGSIFVFAYNVVCSVMRGLGDSKRPLYFVLTASIINIILDILFVGYMHMETRGAALATIISQAVSFLVAFVYMYKHDFVFDFKFKSFKIHMDKLKTIFKIGIPLAIQMSVVNISYLLITGMINVYGINVAAASGIGLKISTFTAMPCWAFGQAVTTMTGQSIGAKKIERAVKTVKEGLKLSIISIIIMNLFVQIFSYQIISAFNENTEVIKEGILYLRICCSFNGVFYAVMYIYDSFAAGVGDSKFAMLNALLHSVVIRIFLSWLFATVLEYGFIGIYVAEFFAPFPSAIVGLIYFYMGRWKKTNLIK